MSDFLSKLDPNVIATLVTALLTFLQIRKNDKMKANYADLLRHMLLETVLELVDLEDAEQRATIALNATVQKWLERIGLKRNAVVDSFIASAVQYALTELKERRLVRQARMVDATSKLAAGTEGVRDAFDETATTNQIPRINLPVEVIK